MAKCVRSQHLGLRTNLGSLTSCSRPSNDRLATTLMLDMPSLAMTLAVAKAASSCRNQTQVV